MLVYAPSMPASKLSAEERAKRHTLQAQSIWYKHMTKCIKQWLKERPDVVPSAYAHMSELVSASGGPTGETPRLAMAPPRNLPSQVRNVGDGHGSATPAAPAAAASAVAGESVPPGSGHGKDSARLA